MTGDRRWPANRVGTRAVDVCAKGALCLVVLGLVVAVLSTLLFLVVVFAAASTGEAIVLAAALATVTVGYVAAIRYTESRGLTVDRMFRDGPS